ncbi:alpha/beta-hydrolase, partial [Acephala macrosclerotiorum]
MYFVGGGMVQGHPLRTPFPFTVATTTSIPIFGVNFRKCVTKKTAFPAALQDAVSAFFYLLFQGFLPENISIMGDSGGGGIAITTLLYLNRQKLPMPGNAILSSPFVDLVDDFHSDDEALRLDFVNPEMMSMVAHQYSENRPDLRGTLLSPARGELPEGYGFDGWPRTFVVWGEVELFKHGI